MEANAVQMAMTIWIVAIFGFFAIFLLIFYVVRTKLKLDDIRKNVNVHIFHVGEKFNEHKIYNCRKMKKIEGETSYNIKLTTNYFSLIPHPIAPQEYDLDEKYIVKTPEGKSELFGYEVSGSIVWFLPSKIMESLDAETKNNIFDLKELTERAAFELKNDFEKYKHRPENKINMGFLIICGIIIIIVVIIIVVIKTLSKKKGA